MARIVLGIGCAHTPQLHTPAEQWEIRAERDRQDGVPLWFEGERMTYAEVEARRLHLDLAAQTDIATRRERLAKCATAIDRLSAEFTAARPDVAVIFGNDQAEMFLDDMKPAFTVMGCAAFVNMPRTEKQRSRLPPGIAIADAGHLPEARCREFPGCPELATHIARHAIANDLDVAFCHRQFHPDPARAQTGGMPHAYGFIYKQIFRDHVVPQVPIDTNTFFAPNQPRAARCFELGKRVGEAIRSWQADLRVAVIASGGLSHFVVMEDFDREILSAMAANDFGRLLEFHEGWYQAGSSEIKSWIAAGGALQGAGLDGHVVDYQALYRTPAGTGSSAAFVYWKQGSPAGRTARPD
jgi:hypothetical protein